jgi:DNA-binding MarR family transcriptional regulator
LKRFIKIVFHYKTGKIRVKFIEMDVLKDLFDEKIISVISLFIENPEKKYFLSDVANSTKINITTTFRILNKLVEKSFLKPTIVGKVRLYQLEKNEKTMELMKILKSGSSPLNEFIEDISVHPRIRKIILESKDKNSAKVLIVGDFLPQEKINKAIEKIKQKDNFKINYVEITEKQFDGLKAFQNYNLEKKIIWKRGKEH